MRTTAGSRRTKNGIIVYDSFNRADNSASIGRSETGHLWIPTGTFGVISGKGYCVSDINAQNVRINVPNKDFICSVKTSGQIASSTDYRVFNLAFKYYDNNNMIRLRLSNGSLSLQKIVTNVTTTLASVSGLMNTNGVEFELKAKCNNDNIIASLDGVDLINFTLSPDDYIFFNPYTACCIRLTKAGSPVLEARFDDFKVVSL